MTPPLYFVCQQNTGGGVLTPSYRIILANKIDCVYLSSPCISCKVTEGLKTPSRQAVYIRNLTPSPCGHSPYIPYRNTGGEVEMYSSFASTSILCAIPQYYGTRQGERIKRGISCFSIRVDFTLLHYNIREGANKLSDNTLSKCSIYVVSKRATSFFYSNRGSRRVVFGHSGRNIPKDFYRTKIGALLSSREFSVSLFFD